ncbi:MAG: patatin-like phospholipase family protein, partial [Candidatus Cloacimonetes bacterium]|nr:patatin-like phospholipase family protein [Candidatus Cloacimonadota bacterium]
MKDLKLGLVLSGGGAKGAYQLGIWKAMEEYELSRQVIAVSGSSVGALNGFMFSYCDYESAEYVWMHQVDKSKFFRSQEAMQTDSAASSQTNLFMDWMPLSNSLGGVSLDLASGFMGTLYRRNKSLGLFSNAGIDELITLASRDIDYGKNYYPSFHVCVYEFMEHRPKYFRVNAITDLMHCKKALLASSAIPLALPPVKLNGMHYYDGGCVDNIPVRPIHDQNLDLIIVVNIEGASTPYDLMSSFPYANILEIKPFKPLGGMMSAMQFDSDFIYSCFQQGYDQGCHIFRDLVSSLGSGIHPQVARSKVQSYINTNLDPYQDEGISLESLSSNLKDFFINTSGGWETAIHSIGADSIWDVIDQGYGY